MSEAEFERRQVGGVMPSSSDHSDAPILPTEPEPIYKPASTGGAPQAGRSRTPRARAVKPKRVQRMFALEEELDRKLWLYAIHVGKDRSEVINELLRPVVASMVLYDSRDRRNGRHSDPGPELAETSGE
jgi:hypothetical protein